MDEKLFEKALSLKRDIDRVDMDITHINEKIASVEKPSDNYFFQVSLPSRFKKYVIDLLEVEVAHLESIKTEIEKEFKEL